MKPDRQSQNADEFRHVREGSSPAKQEKLGLNEDATLHPKRCERDQPHD